jgi:outer membrane biosynthesis protein TonB
MFASSFEQQDREFRTRKNTIAGTVTIVLHVAILLILFYTLLKTPNPPFEEMGGGMSVNFGFDEVGSGETQPFSYNPGPMESSDAASAAAPVAASPEEQLAQENGEEDVVVPKPEDKPKPKVNKEAVYKPNTKPTNNTTTATTKSNTQNENPQPTADPNAMFTKGAYGKPNNSKGDGTGGGQGDQGKPNGDPNSTNYLGNGDGDGTGTGKGDGSGFSLAGRKKVNLPAPQSCSGQGKVVIKIRVDRSGKVTLAEFERFKSTTFDQCNIDNALAAARKATFNSDSDAPEIQTGTITYIYKVN